MQDEEHTVRATSAQQPTVHELEQFVSGASAPPSARVSVVRHVGPNRDDEERWIVELSW